jgi:hypothetical protein
MLEDCWDRGPVNQSVGTSMSYCASVSYLHNYIHIGKHLWTRKKTRLWWKWQYMSYNSPGPLSKYYSIHHVSHAWRICTCVITNKPTLLVRTFPNILRFPTTTVNVISSNFICAALHIVRDVNCSRHGRWEWSFYRCVTQAGTLFQLSMLPSW